MPAPTSNLIDELSRAAKESMVLRQMVLRQNGVTPSGWLAAALWSVLIHGIVTFNAMVWHFPFPETVEADLKFAKGESAQAVEVQLTLMPPVKPSPVEPTEDEVVPPPPPTPPVTESVEQQKPEPFEQTPPPVREPVDGAAPGRSPLANRVLEGDPADVAEPVPMEKLQPGVGPEQAAEALEPVDQPRQEPQRTTPSLASSQVKAQTNPTAKPEPTPIEVTMAALPPTIEFNPPVLTTPTPVPPQVAPAKPIAQPPTETASRPATAGVASGAEAELVKPRYPALSIRAGEEGVIVLEIEVLPDGSVGFVRIVESPGFDRLEKAAIDAVRKSKFSPAQRDGLAVREVVRKTIRFRLQDA